MMMGMLSLFLLTAVVSAAGQLPRGVDPAQASAYSGTGGIFTCLDSSKKIAFARVNDDYCDCADGSDEPGTSACYHGKFWCANRGHEPQLLSASFVDDNICDCCDGSDEALAPCKNTCLDKSSADREARRAKVEHIQRSLEMKQTAIAESAGKGSLWAARAGTVASDIEQQQQEVRRLEAKKVELEAAAEVDRQRIAAEQEAARVLAAAEQEAARLAAVEQEAVIQQAEVAATDLPPVVESPVDTAVDEVVQEETFEERGRRIASQWTHDPDAAGVPADSGSVEHDDPDGSAELAQHEEYDSPSHHDIDSDDSPQNHHDHDAHHTPQHVWTPLDGEVSTVSASLVAAKLQLAALQKEKSDIDRYHHNGNAFDWGPGNMWMALAGRCIIETGTRWAYEACFFEKATQREPHNPTNAVSLGSWRGFSSGYTQAIFNNGDACTGAPNRSFTVQLVCGDSEQLYGGEEPGTCVYRAYLSTPLACTDADLQKEVAHLAELEHFEAEVRAEIEAANQAKASNAHIEL